MSNALQPAATRWSSINRYVLGGFVTILVLVGGVGGWAATTNISGAVLGPGMVVVAGNVKKVQHPTGGVVGELRVKNGDHVKTGDLLIRLDETVTRASLQLITKQIDELEGRKARLRSEQANASAVVFPADLLARRAEPDVGQIVDGEQALFASRMETRSAQKKQLTERIVGMREEIAGTEAQVKAKTKEVELVGKELAGLEVLERQQLVPTSKMMALRREAARIDGERAQLIAAIGQSKGRIAEIEIQKLTIDSEALSDIVKDLRETEGRLAELSERRTAAEDQLKRIDIRSPADGIVHQNAIFTVGGVVTASEPLMLIVPANDNLVVDARISPVDIDQARHHERATIRFSAFNMRTTPVIHGRVTNISADLTTDKNTGQSYYVARIEIDDSERAKLHGLELVPGMPAEVQIETDARTALSYLVKPLEDQLTRAFRER